jgi:MoaA/NifB/PqqE/SkfB family radical SAM enzyme
MHENTPESSSTIPSGSPPRLDIIWNMTAICGWDCKVCCVDAVHVTSRDGGVRLRSRGLSTLTILPRRPEEGSPFDQALRARQMEGRELTLAQKMTVLDNMSEHLIRLDISGGDPLSSKEGMIVLREVAKRIGRENVTLTATGAGMAHYEVSDIAPYIGELNFTYDGEPDPDHPLRPATYARGNLRKAAKFAAAGVVTRGECPLSPQNLEPTALERIYRDLRDAGTSIMLVMRLFPVGRGSDVKGKVPTSEQYRRAVRVLRQLEHDFPGGPRVKLQCALRHLEGNAAESNPCDAFTESFGLTANGTLLGSPWAVNRVGEPIHPDWVLGNLVSQSLSEILESDRLRWLRARASNNHGHCKIFSFLYGSSVNGVERMVESADPLYIKTDAIGEMQGQKQSGEEL